MSVWRMIAEIHHPAIGGVGTNTWHVRQDTDDGTLSEIQSHQDAIEAFYGGCTGVTAGGTSVTSSGEWIRVLPEPAVIQNADPFSVVTGTSADPLPPANCIVAGWGTVSPSRSGRGRTFIGPCAVGTLEGNGTVQAAALTAVRDAQDLIIAHNALAGDGAVGIYSREQLLIRDITSRTVHDQFAVLRSRRD